jgi:hypothetical protein
MTGGVARFSIGVTGPGAPASPNARTNDRKKSTSQTKVRVQRMTGIES